MPDLTFDAVYQIAITAHQAGRWAEAEHYYRQLLAFDPEHPQLNHLLGLIAHQAGKSEEAQRLIQKAISLAPEIAEFHNNLGEVYRASGETDLAHHAYQQALDLKPDYADAITNLGLIHQAAGRLVEAEQHHVRALRLDKGSVVILNNLATALDAQGRRAEAQDFYEQAINAKEDYLKPRLNLALSLLADKKAALAMEKLAKALERFPGNEDLLLTQSRALLETDRPALAIRELESLLEKKSSHLEAIVLLASCYHRTGEVEATIRCYDQALALNPRHMQAAYSRLTSLNYLRGHEGDFMAEEHRKYAQSFYGSIRPRVLVPRPMDKKIRLGYLSNDFKNHSVSRFMAHVIEAHDHTQFTVHCFALNGVCDQQTQRYQLAADHWHKAWELTDEKLGDLIEQQEIDLLIDLGGLFGGRLGLLAQKPAPIQICFLGYPNTTGLDAIDYRLTDTIADPVGLTEQWHTEKLWRLPCSAWCFQPTETEVPILDLPADRFGHITFGSFHGVHKFRPIMVKAWAQILAQLPQALLVIKSFKGLADSDTRERFRAIFEEHQIDLNRIKFVPSSLGEKAHLGLFNNIDIALDTFPYNGTTITCEALWMGVPSITLAGSTHVSRVGASLMTHAGLADVVADSPEDYVRRACALAGDLPRLRALRKGLRNQMKETELGNASLYTKRLEEAYREMMVEAGERA